jgi:hypothetical protein
MTYRRAMTGTKRVVADQCCGAIIDYQDYFLAQLEPRSRAQPRAAEQKYAEPLGRICRRRIPSFQVAKAVFERVIIYAEQPNYGDDAHLIDGDANAVASNWRSDYRHRHLQLLVAQPIIGGSL